MAKVERQDVRSIVQTLIGVLVGGIISYITVVHQSHVQTRTQRTMGAYATYIESVTMFNRAVQSGKIDRSTRERMASAMGSIAIYGTKEVIEKLSTDNSSIQNECVRKGVISTIVSMRKDVGEEEVNEDDLYRLVFGSRTEGKCEPNPT